MSLSTKNVVAIGMFTAVQSVLSILTIPMPSGVPITLQTFSVALCGYVLGSRLGIASTMIYLLLGTIGVPVFAGMTGGPSCLVGYRGGFLWGFLFLTMLCGVSKKLSNCRIAIQIYAPVGALHRMKKPILRIILGLAGLAVCHFLGVLQFAMVTSTSSAEAFFIVSLPYIAKDVMSVIGAYLVSVPVCRAIPV